MKARRGIETAVVFSFAAMQTEEYIDSIYPATFPPICSSIKDLSRIPGEKGPKLALSAVFERVEKVSLK
jgi:hypothetical protein